MNFKAFNISIQGYSHIKNNKECQDYSTSFSDESMAIAITADGHGSPIYLRSAKGAEFATTSAEKNIKHFVKNINKKQFLKNQDALLNKLEQSIINDWNQLVINDWKQHPFTRAELSTIDVKMADSYTLAETQYHQPHQRYNAEKTIVTAYGTTLIATAVTKDYWFGIHIGDGKCATIHSQGDFLQPIPWDERCFLNITTSMCDTNVLNNFRHFASEHIPVAIIACSDGIDDSFNTDEQLNQLYKTILYSFANTDFEEAKNNLQDYLPRLSAKGSGDDVSIAAILDMDSLSELEIIKQFDIEKEKERKIKEDKR